MFSTSTAPLIQTFGLVLSLLYGSVCFSQGDPETSLNKAKANPAKTKTNNTQPELGYRSVKLHTIDGRQFKDLNKNGQLDKYEDWRLPGEERVNDLLAKMSLEEKVGFMLISTTRLKNEGAPQASGNRLPITSDFNEEDVVATNNIFTRKPLPVPVMNVAGTTKGVTQFHLRHFIFRANARSKITAEWANKLQALCESDGLGIPAIIASNPRNHITQDAAIGLSVGKTVFSSWPGELGLSAMHDLKLVREFADIARQEWKAVGLRKGYMYMADLATEPRWQRTEGTFGENADWTAKMITEIILGFQGNKLNSSSVALTTKHFPGGGAGEGGQDPHFDWGKYETFPGKMFENNLIPFKAAIKAGTSAIMPYYSIPKDTEYEEIAYAYNKKVLQDLLRVKLGFKGIINSDTGPIEMMPWGAENLSVVERYKKTLEAGVNLYSGTADPAKLLETVKTGMVDTKLIDESVRRLLLEKFELGLFENPYVDEEAAEKIAGNAKFQERANLALRKSIVLLRNENKALPLKPKTKIYFESYLQKRGSADPHNIFSAKDKNYDVEFVNNPDAADFILLWITPGGKSMFESDGSPISLSLSKNGVDINYINQTASKKPAIIAINYTNPWVIDEIYNDVTKANIKGVISTFGTSADALLDVVIGRFNPTGKIPFTTPVSEAGVKTQKEDVPGYSEGSQYALFKYNEGISYK
ncbi:glycoside hydrolase family 3 protein [Flavitalea sp.]|nr:glycoside hydrolase family 3 N-terminal domain-containing protein [Flavitalea sp.]